MSQTDDILADGRTFEAIVDHAPRQSHPPQWVYYTLYAGMYAACGLAFFTGVSWSDAILCAATYTIRSFGMSVGYHRYFAHRSFKTGRVVQFVLALLGTLAAQNGVIWWARTHREHHRYADTPRDLHSPRYQGFFYSYFLWHLDKRHNDMEPAKVPDLARYPELMWLSTWHFVPLLVFAGGLLLAFGWSGFVWGFVISTVLLWQPTFCIVGLSHGRLGYRRFATPDDTNNNWFISLISFGEGWHNNHHYVPYSARQGFGRYEFDASWWVIQGLEKLGLVWDVKLPPPHVIDTPRQPHAVRFEEQLIKLRGDVADCIEAQFAATVTGDDPRAAATAEVLKQAVEFRFDDLLARVQDLLVRRPTDLPAALTDFRAAVAGEVAAVGDGFGDPFRADLADRVESEISAGLARSNLRHLFQDQRGGVATDSQAH